MKSLIRFFVVLLCSVALAAPPRLSPWLKWYKTPPLALVINPFVFPVVSDTAWVTGETLGTARNDFDGEAGTLFGVGATNITVTQLGRWKISGNSQNHTLKLVALDGTLIASCVVDMSTGSAGAFVYNTISPTVLSASVGYGIVSTETNGGDQWYNYDTTITTTAVTSSQSSTFRVGSSDPLYSAGAGIFIPVDFKYSSP